MKRNKTTKTVDNEEHSTPKWNGVVVVVVGVAICNSVGCQACLGLLYLSTYNYINMNKYFNEKYSPTTKILQSGNNYKVCSSERLLNIYIYIYIFMYEHNK